MRDDHIKPADHNPHAFHSEPAAEGRHSDGSLSDRPETDEPTDAILPEQRRAGIAGMSEGELHLRRLVWLGILVLTVLMWSVLLGLFWLLWRD